MSDNPAKTLTAKGQARRDAILSAARDLYAENGRTALQVSAVCAAAGMTRALFYKYFADADALYQALLDEALKILARRVTAPHAAHPAGADRLKDKVDALTALCRFHPHEAILLSAALRENATVYKALTAELRGDLRAADPSRADIDPATAAGTAMLTGILSAHAAKLLDCHAHHDLTRRVLRAIEPA